MCWATECLHKAVFLSAGPATEASAQLARDQRPVPSWPECAKTTGHWGVPAGGVCCGRQKDMLWLRPGEQGDALGCGERGCTGHCHWTLFLQSISSIALGIAIGTGLW